MKSLVLHLQEYVRAMFKDVAYAYRHPSDMWRDESRLIHELGVNGERILTLDLPALDKHFTKCLDIGLYSPSKLRMGAVGKRELVPVFMRDLYLQIFDVEGKLRDEPSISAISVVRQMLAGAKKLPLPCTVKRVNDEVYDFFIIERGIRSPTLNWVGDDLFGNRQYKAYSAEQNHLIDGLDTVDVDSRDLLDDCRSKAEQPSSEHLQLLQSVFDVVAAQFGYLHDERPDELPKHGPGVVSDLSREESKYSFRDWPEKLDSIFPHDRYATPDLGVARFQDGEVYRNREVPSRLIAVPKTLKAPRLIAAEPSQHQWIQQLIWNQLEARILETSLTKSVSFRSQEGNKELARTGSITREFFTIDLSSASDRLSCWLVERAFRKNITMLHRLHACRTRWITNRINPHLWDNLVLKKYAPMGSAVTFPLQTIIYASIAITAVIASRPGYAKAFKRRPSQCIEDSARQVSVFGDDIIGPKAAWRLTQDLLQYCGLKVNVEKSFAEGHFRESCGGDFYKGASVAPVYLRFLPELAQPGTLTSCVSVGNNFHRAGYWHIADFLRNFSRNYDGRLPFVAPGSSHQGYLTFSGPATDHLDQRWNARLQREEVKVMVVHSSTTSHPTPGYDRLHQWFIESPDPEIRWESGRRTLKASYSKPGWVPKAYVESPNESKRLALRTGRGA